MLEGQRIEDVALNPHHELGLYLVLLPFLSPLPWK